MKKFARAGFTMIELTLSMVFIGILSVTMVLIINNTVQAYRRGMTLNHINTVGMDLVDELRSAVQNASSRSVTADCISYYAESTLTTAPRNQCLNDGAYKFITMVQRGSVELEDGTTINNVPLYGAFCTGTYSYIWNSGYFVNSADMTENRTVRTVLGYRPAYLIYTDASRNTVYYPAGGETAEAPLRLIKIQDSRRGVCEAVARNYNSSTGVFNANYYNLPNPLPNAFDLRGYGVLAEEPVEMLLTDDYNDLVLYDLAVARPAESSTRNNSFYSVSFILGTVRGGINIMAKGKSCEMPENYDVGNFDYCAINKFSFAAQAGNQ